MRTRRLRKTTLLLLSATCGLSTGALTIAALAVLMLDYDVAGISPWLDPYEVSNWLVLCCGSVAAIAFALLADSSDERRDAPTVGDDLVPGTAGSPSPPPTADATRPSPDGDLARAA